MLLLYEIASLTVEGAAYESSSAASRNLHKVLCQLLVLCFATSDTALFRVGLAATYGRSLVCVLLGCCLLDHYATGIFVLPSHCGSPKINRMVLVDTAVATF